MYIAIEFPDEITVKWNSVNISPKSSGRVRKRDSYFDANEFRNTWNAVFEKEENPSRKFKDQGYHPAGVPVKIEQPKNLVMAALLRGRRLASQFIEDFGDVYGKTNRVTVLLPPPNGNDRPRLTELDDEEFYSLSYSFQMARGFSYYLMTWDIDVDFVLPLATSELRKGGQTDRFLKRMQHKRCYTEKAVETILNSEIICVLDDHALTGATIGRVIADTCMLFDAQSVPKPIFVANTWWSNGSDGNLMLPNLTRPYRTRERIRDGKVKQGIPSILRLMTKPLPDDYVSSIVNQDWVQQASNEQWKADYRVNIMGSEKNFLEGSESAKPLIWSSLEIDEHERIDTGHPLASSSYLSAEDTED
jgi:hypothetical protein